MEQLSMPGRVSAAARQSAWLNAGLRLAVLLFCILGCLLSGQARSESSDDDRPRIEQQIKAAMLFKFLSYIEWPEPAFPAPDAPYRIAVLGAERIAENLREICDERAVAGRPVEVVEVDSLRELDDVHMVFIGNDSDVNTRQVDRHLRDRSIVTVTESQQGLAPASVINLRIEDDRVNFDVSLAKAEQRELKVSSRMLSVAASVEKGR